MVREFVVSIAFYAVVVPVGVARAVERVLACARGAVKIRRFRPVYCAFCAYFARKCRFVTFLLDQKSNQKSQG